MTDVYDFIKILKVGHDENLYQGENPRLSAVKNLQRIVEKHRNARDSVLSYIVDDQLRKTIFQPSDIHVDYEYLFVLQGVYSVHYAF